MGSLFTVVCASQTVTEQSGSSLAYLPCASSEPAGRAVSANRGKSVGSRQVFRTERERATVSLSARRRRRHSKARFGGDDTRGLKCSEDVKNLMLRDSEQSK